MDALPQVVRTLVLYYGCLLVGSETISGGQLVAFLLYFSSLTEVSNGLTGAYGNFARALCGAKGIFDLMDAEGRSSMPEDNNSSRVETVVSMYDSYGTNKPAFESVAAATTFGHNPGECLGEVTIDNAFLREPAKSHQSILNKNSLTIPQGSIVAFVGAPDSGITSIALMLQNLCKPSSGRIYIDGIPVRRTSLPLPSKNFLSYASSFYCLLG